MKYKPQMTTSTGTYQDLFNTDTSSDIFAGLVPNSVVVTDRDSMLQSEPLPDGNILAGTASGVRGKSLSGTERQVSVTNDAEEIKLSLPQDIDTVSRPRFSGVRVSDDIDFVFDPSDPNAWQSRRQTIQAAEPFDVDRTWTLPLISDAAFQPATTLTFAALEGRQTFTGPKTFWDTIRVYDVVPVVSGYSLGSTDRRFRNLYLGYASGTIDLGIDTGGRAELKLVSNGSSAQNVTFGESSSEASTASWNWRLSGRDLGEGRHFNLYRGGYLTESDPEVVLQCRSDTGAVVFPKTTDSTDRSTGAVRFLGGIGVAKSVHAKHINAESVSSTSVATGTVTATDVTATGSLTAATLNVTTGITIPGLTANSVVGTDSAGGMQSLALASATGVTAAVAGGVLTINTPQDLRTTAVPTFSNLWFAGASKSVGELLLLVNQDVTFRSSPHFDNVTVYENLDVNRVTSNLVPSGQLALGSSADKWRGLHFGQGTSYLGLTGDGDAQLVLDGQGGKTQHISFSDSVNGLNWQLSGRSNRDFHFYRGVDLVYDCLAGSGQFRFLKTTPATSTTTGAVQIRGGLGVDGAIHTNALIVNSESVNPANYVTLDGTQTITGTKTFGHINATSMNVGGVGLQPANYVLTHSNQTIGGQKTFSGRIVGNSDIMLGTHNYGVIRLSSYGGGDARIEGGYVTDAEYFLRFVCRGERVAEMIHGYEGSGRTREFHLYGGLYFPNGGNTRMSYYGVVNLNTSFVAEGTASINTNPAVTIRCARVGHMVTLDFAPSQTNFHVTNGNPALITQVAIAAQYRPSSTKQGSCIVNNQSNQYTPALVSVNSLGIVKIAPGPNGYFTGSLGSNNNLYSFSISYNL